MPTNFEPSKMDGRLMVDASLVSELLDTGQWCYQNVHTHTPGKDGLVKLHFPLKFKATLGQFFESWGRPQLLKGAKAKIGNREYDNPAEIALKDDMAIVLFLSESYKPRGTPKEKEKAKKAVSVPQKAEEPKASLEDGHDHEHKT